MWNEPNFEAGAEETLKCILGGDPCNVKVKYANDACLRRTPVIILTNRDIIPKNQAFQSRTLRFYWKSYPELRFCTKKPLPFAFFYLLIKYNLLRISDLEEWGKKLCNI